MYIPLKNGIAAKAKPKARPEVPAWSIPCIKGLPSIKFCDPTVATSPAASKIGSYIRPVYCFFAYSLMELLTTDSLPPFIQLSLALLKIGTVVNWAKKPSATP